MGRWVRSVDFSHRLQLAGFVPTIIDTKYYDGAEKRISRLGLGGLLLEIQQTLANFQLLIAEQKNANGAAAIREMLDDRFKRVGGWTAIKSGGIDWTKCVKINGARACVGLELQFSARSDLLTNDLTHLMAAIEGGDIDVGVIVVPADKTAPFLTDRSPWRVV
jgi:hypothetical protein